MIRKFLATGASVAALALSAGAAHALTWTTQLEYDASGKIASLGVVTVTDGLNFGQDVQVEVALDAGAFVDTGGHYTFAFNLDNDAGNTVTVNKPLPDGPGGAVDFIYENTWSQQVQTCKKGVCTTTTVTDPPPYKMAPFGDFNNAFVLNPDGGNNTVPSPFIFTVHNDAGLTFAGLGKTPGPGGLLTLPLGTGLHFESNTTGNVPGAGPGGWWFAVDTSGTDGNCSPTCVIAGRDAISRIAVPEPATWALMIAGFGGAGAMLRRRRTALA